MRSAAAWTGFVVLVVGVAVSANPQPSGTVAGPPAPAPAPKPAGPDLSRTATQTLVDQLGSDDFRVREAAGRELNARAEKALPELRRALAAATDPEVARRLQVLVRKLDFERLVAPKRVTMKMTDKPVKDIIAEFAKQTGYKIQFGGGDDGKHSFEFTDTPFWVAIDQVAAAAGLNVYPDYDEDGGIRAYAQDSYNPHVSYSGPFRFVATNISTNKNVQLSGLTRRGGQPRPPEYVNLNFQVQSEPKIPMLGTSGIELTEAVDEFGGSLIPPRNDPNAPFRSHYYNGGYRGYNVYANLNLTRANRNAASMKLVKGKVMVTMLTGTRPEVAVADPLKVKNKKFAGRTAELDIDTCAENNGTVTVSLTVRRVGGDPQQQDWNWSNSVWQKLEVQDAKGVKYRNFGPNQQNNTGNSVTLTMNFGNTDSNGNKLNVGPPARLLFNEWLSATHEVPFEFKDIPLP